LEYIGYESQTRDRNFSPSQKKKLQDKLPTPESVSASSPEPRPREVASLTVDFCSSEISDTIKTFFSVTLVWDKAEP